MGTVYTLGLLTAHPLSERPELLPDAVRSAIEALGWMDAVGIAEIDPAVSDTAATQAAFELDPWTLANCVVVGGSRSGQERIAACVALATTRVDVNRAVRKRLDVRSASFLPMDRAVEETGMEYGGITPVGLPKSWSLYVDARVIQQPVVIVGSGIRASKLVLPGRLLADIPGAEVVDDLALELPRD
jgi:prolyl-tRNA editing enzyme YbaK/EbsC (Cys-tRNA(Pro) deacylase)